MERKQKNIAFYVLVVLAMVTGSIFYFLYLKNYTPIEDIVKEIQVKKAIHDSCLEENEFADYVIDATRKQSEVIKEVKEIINAVKLDST